VPSTRIDRAARTAIIAAVALLFVQAVAAETVVLFQPGQSGWEWLLVPSKHDGGKRMREGKSCLFCHEDEARLIGDSVTGGNDLEPQPVAGMPGFVELSVAATYDDENLYLQACWDAPASGRWGDGPAESLLTFSLGSPALNVAPIAGCWAACHMDLPDMSSAAAGQSLTKYLPGSRNKMTATGGGDDVRDTSEIQGQLAEGKYLEFWQLVLANQQVTGAADGHFLAERVTYEESAVSGSGSAQSGDCSLQLVRSLAPGGEGRHTLREGEEYTLNIALHANHAEGRYHFTSFPLRFRLGDGEAELVATRQ
jgi:hypothetical protein